MIDGKLGLAIHGVCLVAAAHGFDGRSRCRIAADGHLGVPVRQIRASGGGARSPFWRQIQADVNNAPLVTLNIDEGPAYGAALLAGAPAASWWGENSSGPTPQTGHSSGGASPSCT